MSLLVDPALGRSIFGGIERNVPPGVPVEQLPRIDASLVTHSHYDHLDLPTLRAVEAPVVAGLGLARYFRDRGLAAAELGWWEATEVKGLRVTFVPAHHWSRRGPFDTNETLWGGFVVEGESATVYHSGDTAYFAGFKEIAARFPRIDAALLPVGAYEPGWFMLKQHMDPEQALQAFEDLGARTFVAMHWGTFKLADEPLDEPPRRVEAESVRRGLARERVRVPAIGETLVFRAPAGAAVREPAVPIAPDRGHLFCPVREARAITRPATSLASALQYPGSRAARIAGGTGSRWDLAVLASLSLRSAPSRSPCARPSHAEGRARAARRRTATTPGARAGRSPGRLVVGVAMGLLSTLLLTACEPFVEGNGRLRLETRTVPAFEGVHVESGIAVEVHAHAAETKLVVSGDENVLQHVQTDVRPDHGRQVLFVRSTAAFGSTNPVRADISVPSLRYLAALDRATAIASGVEGADRFEVEGVDGATLRLSGSGGTSLEVHLAGGSHGGSRLEASDYPVATASVDLGAGSTAALDASERVTGTASGAGAVQIQGGGSCEVTPSSACVPVGP